MSVHHSAETHQSLIARIPQVTGRPLPDWLETLDAGPSLARFDDRVSWLRSEHGLAHGHAVALVHEHDVRRTRARAS
jgi:hypothetical protein